MMKREKTESDMASGIKHLTHSLSLFFSWSLWSKCIYSLFSTSVSFVTISLFAVSLLFQEYIHTNVNVPLSSTMKQNWMKGKKDFSKLDNNNWRKRRSWERDEEIKGKRRKKRRNLGTWTYTRPSSDLFLPCFSLPGIHFSQVLEKKSSLLLFLSLISSLKTRRGEKKVLETSCQKSIHNVANELSRERRGEGYRG